MRKRGARAARRLGGGAERRVRLRGARPDLAKGLVPQGRGALRAQRFWRGGRGVRGGAEAACDRPAIRIRVGDLLRNRLRSAVRQVPVRKHEPPAAAAGMKQCDWISSLKQASFRSIYCYR